MFITLITEILMVTVGSQDINCTWVIHVQRRYEENINILKYYLNFLKSSVCKVPTGISTYMYMYRLILLQNKKITGSVKL